MEAIGFAAPAALHARLTPAKKPRCREHGANSWSARARDQGGFHLPPRVPEDRAEMQRAYELLGNRTQRILSQPAERELEGLIGTLPATRTAAQTYKGAFEMHMRRERRLQNGVLLTTALTRTRYMDRIVMPKEDADISRAFCILQAVSRKGEMSHATSVLLQRLIGMVPRDSLEAKRASNALKRLARERRRQERLPPRTPPDMKELGTAYALLGTYAAKGTVGRRRPELESLLGSLPRTTNIAMHWKKYLQMIMRKTNHKAQVHARRRHAEIVREQRRMRREANMKAFEDSASSAKNERGPTERLAYFVMLTVVLGIGIIGGPPAWNATVSRLRVH